MNFVVPNFAPAYAELFVAAMGVAILLVAVFLKQSARQFAYLASLATLLGAAYA